MDFLLTQLRISKDDLETEKFLGTGAYGAIFLGQWKSKNCKVAIKMVHVENNETMGMLCNELNAMANYKYKHICQLYGVSIISEEELWMVLEYVDGLNLHEYLISHKPVPWAAQISFALQAAKALNYLHSQNPPQLHKDIKSLSLLVDAGTLTVKLTEFGISQASEFVTSQTNVIGSLRWAAPEVAKPSKLREPKYSEKSDIYSLGMVFFEIITGEFPFRYDSNFGSIAKKIKGGVRPVIPQHCPSKFADIMLQCWETDPDKRPTSQELVTVLTEIEDTSTRSLLTCSAVGNLKRSEINFSQEKNKSCVVQ
eukprot:Phypoly_transcript_10292.p1 GENE.Phypoly_transcript_10292~~Phypoly_transcript_10292.p1  ORF type:complete len:311 (+),score=28.63 Phypoly_transcript_10292:351-1283(+)